MPPSLPIHYCYQHTPLLPLVVFWGHASQWSSATNANDTMVFRDTFPHRFCVPSDTNAIIGEYQWQRCSSQQGLRNQSLNFACLGLPFSSPEYLCSCWLLYAPITTSTWLLDCPCSHTLWNQMGPIVTYTILKAIDSSQRIYIETVLWHLPGSKSNLVYQTTALRNIFNWKMFLWRLPFNWRRHIIFGMCKHRCRDAVNIKKHSHTMPPKEYTTL